MAKERVHQLGQNNAKLMNHIESLLEQHGEMAKLLLVTIKKMHGTWGEKVKTKTCTPQEAP